jgi:hypothetical protein
VAEPVLDGVLDLRDQGRVGDDVGKCPGRGDGAVWVNGTKLDEPYVFENQPTTAQSEPATWTVCAGQLFVLGVAVRRCSPSEAPLQ